MAAPNFLYAHPSDVLTPSAISAGFGSIDSAYPLTNANDGNPAKPVKATAAILGVVFDFGVATAVKLVAGIGHNCTTVYVAANTANSWGAPAYQSANLTIAADEDGFYPNAIKDVSAVASYRYWLLYGSRAAGIAQFGEVIMTSAKRSLRSFMIGNVVEDLPETLMLTTPLGVEHRYQMTPRKRRYSGAYRGTLAEFASLRSWHRASRGSALASLIVPDDSVVDCLYGRFTEDTLNVRTIDVDVVEAQMSFSELSTGLAP